MKAKITAYILLFFFWLIGGVFLAPLWLLVVIVGWLLDVFTFKEMPSKFWDLFMIKWFTGG